MLKTIMRFLFRIFEFIAELKVKSQLKSIDIETDSMLKLEKQIVYNISGVSLGGMAAGTAFVEFKSTFYECISDPSEKLSVNTALIRILKSNNYTVTVKAKISYVCADIKLTEAIYEVEALLNLIKEGSSEQRIVLRSLDALRKNVSMTEKNYTEAMKD